MFVIKYSKLSKYQLKKIMYHFCVDVDATRTGKLLGFNRNTTTSYFKMFREAIYLHQITNLNKFYGNVELDESYFGGKRIRGYHGKLKRGRGTLKQPVFGVFERKDEVTGKKRVYTEIVEDCKKKTLQAIIRGKIDVSAVIHTDGWRGYNGLVDVGYDKHFRVNHSKDEFALKGEEGDTVTVNGMESFWSFTKRRLAKFNGTKKNFELHLKESEWRWDKDENELFDELQNIFKSYLRFFSLSKPIQPKVKVKLKS